VAWKKYSITERKNRSGSISYRVAIGNKRYKFFSTKRDAIDAVEELKDSEVINDREEQRGLGILLRDKYTLMDCQQLCEKWGVGFREVFDFYQKHGEQSKDINITIDQGIKIVLDTKKKDQYVSAHYLNHLSKFSFKNLRNYFGGDHLVKKITQRDFQKYLRSGSWGIPSKNHLIVTAKTYFNCLKEAGHIGLNPIQKLKSIPLDRAPEYEIFKVKEVRAILNQCLLEKNYSFLAAFVLVLYCGCRVGETKKILWQDIRYWDKPPSVRVTESVSKKTKKLRPRTTQIPPNAQSWLRFCYSTYTENRTEKIIQISGSYFYVQTRKLAARAGVKTWNKNVLRHCFASYGGNHLGLTEVSERMGHHRGTEMLRDNYLHLTTFEESARYFDIYPNKKSFPDDADAETLKLVERDLAERKKS
tara:strand:- start:689 stop:1939 length:1251 start_codon:yes stop_codon:yes gene_type:complete